MEYTKFEVRPMTGSLGAELHGINLADEHDADTIAEVRDAWVRYKVVFFRDQEMTPEQHMAFAANFGEFQPPGFVPTLPDYPAIRKQEMDDADQVGTDVTWHSDDTYLEIPSRGSVLYALDVPDAGGDTTWLDMAKAYQTLSKPMREFLDGLTAVHDLVETMGPGILRQYGAERWQSFRDRTPAVEHPLVRTHPETGEKGLFVNPLMTWKIKDLSDIESHILLQFLYRHMTQPENAVRFHWRKGSVAFWDNRITAHKGIFDFGKAHRLMHRVAIADDARPV